MLVAPAGYHRRMKEVCEAHDILYVSDEVVTAFGRLGHFFSSKDRFDVMSDMIVTAKGITSGYLPLAATLVSDRIFDAIARRPDGALLTHGFTYSGHAVACAVAIANIGVMEREDLCGRGAHLPAKLLGGRNVDGNDAAFSDALVAAFKAVAGARTSRVRVPSPAS